MRRAGSADRRLADADRSGDGGYHHAGGACGAARRAAVRACRRAAWRGRYRRIAAADGPGLGAGRSREPAFAAEGTGRGGGDGGRSEEHTSEFQSLMRISYAVFCLKKKKKMHEDNIKA